MAKQLITVGPDGSLFGLDHKSKGLNLRSLGRGETKRATLVEFDEELQMWYIRWEGQRSNEVWTYNTVWDPQGLIRGELCKHPPFSAVKAYTGADNKPDNIPLWENYEDAVAAEVEVIQKMQTLGYRS